MLNSFADKRRITISVQPEENLTMDNNRNEVSEAEVIEDEKIRKKPFVLVAEDTDSNYLLLSAILKKEYELSRANDGVEVVEMCQELHPDVILMDMRMPRMDGLQATREIRKFNTSVPILAVTAFAYEQDRQSALAAGCDGFLTKPVSVVELRNTLKKWFRNE